MCLTGWQTLLAPYLSKIELLSELPLDRTTHVQLEQALADFVQKQGLTEATRRFKAEYPAAFIAYLAFKAAFNEERGFWEQIARAIGLEGEQPLFHPAHHWGKTFQEVITAHPNLRQFHGISGHEYLTPIRLHGGIPAFSLPDFFRYILLPSVEKAPYDGMEDAESLRALLGHYTAELFVDDVVRHFFNHSGEAGLSFFKKCRRMARLALQENPLNPAEIGLRPYVIQCFETFQQKQSVPSLRRRRPRLFFDPYLPAFRIILPPQPLTLEQAGQRYTARLYSPSDGDIYQEKTRLRPVRQGQEWHLEEIEWVLEEPLEAVQVSLFAPGAEQSFPPYFVRLLPPADFPPLLAFDYETTRQVLFSPGLPTRALWLLYPIDCEIRFEGAARQLQSLQFFGPPWHNWQASAWELSEVRLLRLLRAGQDICPPISVSRPLEPSLRPSGLPLHVLAVEEKPLYNTMPVLCLPLQNSQNSAEELKGWHLRLESRYAARPQGEWQAKGDELPFIIEKDEAHLPLSCWLGEAPAGTYHLTLSRRGHSTSEMPFRVCAGLDINGLQPYYLPDSTGSKEVTFSIHLPSGFHLLVQDEENVSTSSLGGGQEIKVSPNASQANLLLELPTEPEPVRVPLQIRIPRLRWALTLETGAALEWAHQLITRPLAELLQTDLSRARPRLRVDLPALATDSLLAELHLNAPGRDHPLQTSPSRTLTARWLDFDLGGFFDTLRAHPQELVFEFVLELLDTERNLNVRLPVLRFSRELEIRVCHFESVPPNDWRLHWYEPHPLRHRRLRLWSLWQPWADPAEIPLPDNAPPSDSAPAQGWWMCDIPSDIGLPPSHYRAHFVAVAPYEKNLPPVFPPENAIKIEMVTPEAHLRHIENALQNATPGRRFALHFEKLCIYYSDNRHSEAQEESKWCLAHWGKANLFHLEALARWLGEYDKDNQPAFLMHLFREESLEQLEKGHFSPEFKQRYLENLLHAHTLKPESARRILTMAHNPAVILRALQLLMKSSQDEEACRIFWDFLAQGRFSEADAVALLKDHANFVRRLLQAGTPASLIRARLLRELSRHLDLPEYIVKVGYFVLCDAGWGKILEIRGGKQENLFISDEEAPTLLIELLHWSGQKAELDLSRRQIRLLERNGVNRCACGHFAALGGEQTRTVWEKHRAFCGQSGVSPLPASFSFSCSLVYRATAPENPLDTRSGE